MRGSREGDRGPEPPSLKYHKKGFLSNTSLDPLKNHKAAKPAFNVGPSSARQRNAFCWWANGGPHLVALDSFSSPLIMNKKQNQQQEVVIHVVGPPLTKLSGPALDKY